MKCLTTCLIGQQLEIKSFWEHLKKNPSDWEARGLLADLYCDVGDKERSEYQRWAIKNKRHPKWHSVELNNLTGWKWYSSLESHCLEQAPSQLGRIFLYVYPGDSYDNWLTYPKLQEAEDKLMQWLSRNNWPDVVFGPINADVRRFSQ